MLQANSSVAQDALSDEDGGASVGQGPLELEAPQAPNAWKKSLLPNGGPATGWHQDKPVMPAAAGAAAAAPAAAATSAPALPRSRLAGRPPKEQPHRDSCQPAPPAAAQAAAKQAAARVDEPEAPEELAAALGADLKLGSEAAPAAVPVPAEPAPPKGLPMSWRKVLAGAGRERCYLRFLYALQHRRCTSGKFSVI